MRTVVLVSLISTLLPPSTSQTSGTIQRVSNIAELRARTSAEQARAEHFDMPDFGFSVLEHEHVARIPERALAPPVPPPPPPPGQPPLAPPPPETDADRLKALACRSDIVIVGHAEAQRTLLTKSENFFFTDFEVAVERWIRPASSVARTVSASLLGGEVELAGRRLSATFDGLPKLHQPYVFFLRKLRDDVGNVPTETPLKIDTPSLDVSAAILAKPVALDLLLKELQRAVERCSRSSS